MSIRISCIIIFLLLAGATTSGQFSVRIYTPERPQSILVRVPFKGYTLTDAVRPGRELPPGTMLLIGRAGERLAVNINGEPGYLTDSAGLQAGSGTGFLTLSIPGLEGTRRDYHGSISFVSSLGVVRPVNLVDEERYLAAVVQAEGGYNGHPEYKKSQAVIARTYAWMHTDRHADEGYQLCDDVHCQVYKGRSVTPDIDSAVTSTGGEVIASADSVMVFTPFHSNCGSETVPSDWVWLTNQAHLVSVIDPYCSFSRNAVWEKSISTTEWIDYLVSNGASSASLLQDLSFSQPARRQFLESGGLKISLARVRGDLALRSAFFSVKHVGDSVVLSGRGYGHGVGLCQEGAMVMAQRGYNYRQILNFYYNNILILNRADARIEKGEIVSF